MIGMLVWKEPQTAKGKIYVAERSVLHMRFFCAEIARGNKTRPAVLKRRVQAAARRLRKLGVDRVVLPEGFAHGEWLEKTGLRPVSTLPLRRALAADWVRTALEGQKTGSGAQVAPGARVAVAAAQLTGEVVRTVTELALRHRYVLLDLPYGGEALCRQLRREYGVSLLLGPAKEQLEEADALVLFDRRGDLRPRTAVTLELYEGGGEALPPLVLPPALEERLPAGADRGQLLAALQEAGVLRPGQITIGTGC